MFGLREKSIDFVLHAHIRNAVYICIQLYEYTEAKNYGERVLKFLLGVF